jgi:hypothetical protein
MLRESLRESKRASRLLHKLRSRPEEKGFTTAKLLSLTQIATPIIIPEIPAAKNWVRRAEQSRLLYLSQTFSMPKLKLTERLII